ncbi:hypothetical protein BJ085DRAFT_40177 [Dimargaris cristalligena]|uniref:Uncharacterized protein n=1 Tax=Dimargaris cristalligena TaxID=215637 RepID=A0A4V1J3X3_9FUNG|nr:hypothetical protein BJ085DRAFT_40177 [Dimargaris cristalligena]|eukprot:RKP33559.1 hypothetical protein BJ085DRAFT_40177 [Dimargaris cristalligena]
MNTGYNQQVGELGPSYGGEGESTTNNNNNNEQNTLANFDNGLHSISGARPDNWDNRFASQHYPTKPKVSTGLRVSHYKFKIVSSVGPIHYEKGSRKLQEPSDSAPYPRPAKLPGEAFTSEPPKLIYALDWSKETGTVVPYFFTGEQGYLCERLRATLPLFSDVARTSYIPIFGLPNEMERVFTEVLETYMGNTFVINNQGD